jgi:Translation elongation factor EF-1alpha (GTPase)
MELLNWIRGKKKQENTKEQEGSPKQDTAPRMYTFVVQDIFTIKSQGCVVVGMVEGDTIRVGDPVYIVKRNKRFLQSTVTAMENPVNGRMKEAPPKVNVALMFRDISSSELEKGDVICNVKPTFAYKDGEVNPRLQGLLAEKNHTILKNLEDYIQEEMALYRRPESACAAGEKKGGAELPR